MNDLYPYFRAYRRGGHSPAFALRHAKESKESGKTPRGFYSHPLSPGVGGTAQDSRRWIESPRNAGLRFVGYADEIARRYGLPRAIAHTGWYCDSGCFETLRGVVYQLPGRNGKARYVPGYAEQEGRGPINGGSALLNFGGIEESITESPWDYCGQWEAARAADAMAQQEAEKRQEYDSAWQAVLRWQEAQEAMTESRAEARALVRDMRAAIRSGIPAAPSICAALRAQLRRLLRQWEESRGERDNMADSFHYWEHGKSLSIEQFAAANL